MENCGSMKRFTEEDLQKKRLGAVVVSTIDTGGLSCCDTLYSVSMYLYSCEQCTAVSCEYVWMYSSETVTE